MTGQSLEIDGALRELRGNVPIVTGGLGQSLDWEIYIYIYFSVHQDTFN